MSNDRTIAAIKESRRRHLAKLLDEHGKVGLSNLVNISGDYLWQMGKGKGISSRGVSDKTASKIESEMGKPPGWLESFGEGRPSTQLSQSLRLDPDMIAETHKALRKLEERSGRAYNLEDDPAWFLRVYTMRVTMPAKPSDDEWVEFGQKMIKMTALQGAIKDGRSDGVPSYGTDSERQARGLPSKT